MNGQLWLFRSDAAFIDFTLARAVAPTPRSPMLSLEVCRPFHVEHVVSGYVGIGLKFCGVY